ncbi:MAG: alpha-L-fucosidase [Clostridia bacterium]
MAKFEKWHNETPFGMFVHWGVHSLTEYHCQYLMRMRADRKDYEQLYKSFNPTEYNPDELVNLAYECGMKYLCFTTKHHDGFCMWDTKTTHYNIMNTPYGKDVFKMLQLACEKKDIKLCVYYSIPDWHQENAYNEKSTHQVQPRETDEPNMNKYKQYVKAQITELLTNYGEISTLFWDIPPKYHDASINDYVRKLQPNILINDRGFDDGDFATPERNIPKGEIFTKPTEACQSFGRQSWGYRKNEDYYSSDFITQGIDKIMAMGGNYLLNLGPMSNGEIPDVCIDKFKAVGKWYKKVEESLHGAKAIVLFKDKENILTTVKDNNLYIHFYGGLNISGMVFDPITVMPKNITILNDSSTPKASLDIMPTFYQREDAYTRYLHIYDMPCEKYTATATVLKLEFEDGTDIEAMFSKDLYTGESRF